MNFTGCDQAQCQTCESVRSENAQLELLERTILTRRYTLGTLASVAMVCQWRGNGWERLCLA